MSFDRNLLPDIVNYLEGHSLRLVGPQNSKWKTTACQFHGGSDSMRFNTHSGGFCCMSCGVKGGDLLAYHQQLHNLEFIDAAKQLGAWVDDGRPQRPQKATPLSPRAAMEVMGYECNLVAVAAGNVAKSVILSANDLSRLLAAAGRINHLVGAYA